MRRFARMSAMCLAALAVSACSDYLPNAETTLPEGGPPQEDRGLVVEITADKSRVAEEGEVVFTVNTTGGSGNYRYTATMVDCYEDSSGRELCNWQPILTTDGGPVLTFSRYRRAIDTKMTVTVMAREFSTAKSGEAVHHLLGPNDRLD